MDVSLAPLLTFFKNLQRPHPARDWLIVSTVSGIIGILGIALAAYLFFAVQTGSIISGATEVPRAPVPVSAEAVKNVLDTYQTRANNYASKTFPAVDLSDPRPRTVRR